MDQFQKAYEFSHNWFRGESGEDFLQADGISFGVIPQVYVYQKYLDLLSRHSCRPSLTRENILRYLKDQHLDWPMRAVSSRVYGSLFGSQASVNTSGYVFVYDVHNRGMIESLLRVEDKVRETAETTALTFEPRVFECVRRVGKRRRVLLFPSGLRSDGQKVRQLHECLQRGYRHNRSTISSRINKALYPDLRSAMLRWLDHLTVRFYKDLARDYDCLTSFLEGSAPECIVAASDSHRFSRLITLMARRDGIRTLVVQHGATVSPHAYVPVYADRIAVWGKVSQDWFLNHGVSEGKIVVTGQPRLDDIKASSAVGKASMDSKGTEQVLVLATNPIGAGANKEIWDTVNAAVEKIGFDGKLVLKMHPG